MRWFSQRWLLWPLVPLALLIAALLLPVERLREDARPLVALEANLLLSDGSTARQTVTLTGAPEEQVALRVWALLEPSDGPYLYARCTSAGRVVSEAALPLPTNDRAYHAIDGPWCDTHGQRSLALTLEGNGVRLMTTGVDRVPGTLFKDAVAQQASDLVLQVRQRQPGIDRYLPVSRWASNKPGLLGWPRLYLLLPLLYLLLLLALLRAVARWRHA